MTSFLRTIFHVDMDAFFVSVEELFDPELKGKAVVVGGQRDERGVVSAASYEARKFGVHSAMPLRTAAKLCPHAIFVNGHPDRYRECSEKVHRVLTSFSPQVEMASIDEAYLDMTGTERLHGPPLRAAHLLHQKMKDGTQLNCSIGIGISRLIAKVSSAKAKPNGVLWIVPGQEAKFLAPLDVREIPGVGKVTEQNLHGLGIRKVGDLARFDEAFSKNASENGDWRWREKRGAKMPAAGSTVKSEPTRPQIHQPRAYLQRRHRRHRAAGVHADATFGDGRAPLARRRPARSHHSTQITLQRFHDDHARALFAVAHAARQRNLRADPAIVSKKLAKGAQVRLLGVQASSFEDQAGAGRLARRRARQRWQQALSAADRLRDKFGESSVSLAAGLEAASANAPTRIPAGLPGKGRRERNCGRSASTFAGKAGTTETLASLKLLSW